MDILNTRENNNKQEFYIKQNYQSEVKQRAGSKVENSCMHSCPSDPRLPAWEPNAVREETEIIETDVLATSLQIQGESLSQGNRKKVTEQDNHPLPLASAHAQSLTQCKQTYHICSQAKEFLRRDKDFLKQTKLKILASISAFK